MARRFNQEGDDRGAEARASMESQDKFFTLYWPRLLHFLIAQASNASLAEDVASGTFVKALDGWDKLLTFERPDSWLFKVAIRELRRQEAKERAKATLPEEPADNMADLLRVAATRDWVADNLVLIAAVRTLPRRLGEVIACMLADYTTRKRRRSSESLRARRGRS